MDTRLKEKINALYDRNMTLREIGDKLSISHETARGAIPRQKIRKKRMSWKEAMKIYKTYKKHGESYQEAAERLNIPKRTIVYRVVKMVERRLQAA